MMRMPSGSRPSTNVTPSIRCVSVWRLPSFNAMLEVDQLFCTVGGPHEVLDSDAARGVLLSLPSRDQVHLEASRGQQQRGILIMDGDLAAKHIAIEGNRSVEF